MSLDVYLETEPEPRECRCETCGLPHISPPMSSGVYWANITHNLNTMADKAGIYEALWRPEEIGATHARHIVGKLREGLEMLRSRPDHFRQWNASNGWGTYEALVGFVAEYLAACEEHPDALIRVSR